MSTQPTGLTPQQAFDAAYWAHQAPAVQALRSITDDAQREATAMQLAEQGYTIDMDIMVYGWSPYLVMREREADGYPWVPSALMPAVQLAPGLTQAGKTPYDPLNPPHGAIIVSTNIADYPPYATPAPPPHPPEISLVGSQVGTQNYYQALPAATLQLKDGDSYTADPRGAFTFHIVKVMTPFGPEVVAAWFTLN